MRQRSRRATTEGSGRRRETVGRKIGGHADWLLTPLGLKSQPTQCQTLRSGQGDAAPPLNPQLPAPLPGQRAPARLARPPAVLLALLNAGTRSSQSDRPESESAISLRLNPAAPTQDLPGLRGCYHGSIRTRSGQWRAEEKGSPVVAERVIPLTPAQATGRDRFAS